MRCAVGQGPSPHSLSIDRIIPQLGYTPGNVVLCTNRANMVKSDLTLAEIKQWLPSWYTRIIKYWKSINFEVPEKYRA